MPKTSKQTASQTEDMGVMEGRYERLGGYEALEWFDGMNNPPPVAIGPKSPFLKPDGTPGGDPIPIQTPHLPPPPKDKPR